MPRFANMLSNGLKEKGHQVQVWSPAAKFYNLPLPNGIRKWLGYIDQYILFPLLVKRNLKSCDKDTLFVFADQALGPWVPLVSHLPHVIHCHDFLAQKSALGKIAENPTSWTGKKYQEFIRAGYRKGQNFISVSQKTQEDLHDFLLTRPSISKVVYNGLNQAFKPEDSNHAKQMVKKATGIDVSQGYILHVGGNQWYKNRPGVIEIYSSWRSSSRHKLPLLLVGAVPDLKLMAAYEKSKFKNDIYFLTGHSDENVRWAYAGASVFLYPSIAEGFGWPIAEAMASGCIVITTGSAPMTEVGGDAALYLSPESNQQNRDQLRMVEGACLIEKVLDFSVPERMEYVKKSLANVKRFDIATTLSKIESIYLEIATRKTKQLPV